MTKQDKWDYIAAHYGRDKTLQEIADHTCYCTDNVMAVARRLRKVGIQIPNYNKVSIGTITTRMHNGYAYKYIKTDTGWKRLKKDPKEHIYVKPGPKPKPSVKVAVKPAKGKAPTDKRNPDYQAQGQVRIRPVDLVNNHFVNTKRGTWVLKPINKAV